MPIIILTLGFIVLLLMGIPLAMSLGLSALGAAFYSGMNIEFSVLSATMQYGIQSFLLIGIPLFILTAKIMNTSGITETIFDFANSLVGFMPGGLAQANVIASLIFSGMSGSAFCDAAGLGQIELKAMTKKDYPMDMSVAVTATSSLIGPIFPPSIPLVIYSFVSSTSVGRLFLGGVIPGILMAVSLMLMVFFYSKKHNVPHEQFPTFAIFLRSFTKAFWPLLTPVILLGGIWGGTFTPTEAAGIAAFYALIISLLVIRNTSPKDLFFIFVETAKESAIFMILVSAASFYSYVVMRLGLIIQLVEWTSSLSHNPLFILLVIVFILLVIGCFMEPSISILVLGPPLAAIANNLGIDLIHFGIVMVLALMIGLLTPPVGDVLYVMAKLSGLKLHEVIQAILPFLIPLLIIMFLIIIFPGLVTTLPNLIMGRIK